MVATRWATEIVTELVRFTTEGTLDGSFGVGGRVRLEEDRVHIGDALTDEHGRLVVVGSFRPAPGSSVVQIRRYTEHGALDSSFGEGGIISLEESGMPEIQFIEHEESSDRLIGCDNWDEDGILRCIRLWL